MVEKVEKKKSNHAKKGQSLVELALTLLIILTLLAGVVDLGMAFFSYVSLRDAAQEGALYGSIKPIVDSDNDGRYDVGEPLNASEIVNRVRQSSSTPVNLNDLSNVTVNVAISDPPCESGWIKVTAIYNYRISMPFLGAILGSTTIPLSASATDTILQPACP